MKKSTFTFFLIFCLLLSNISMGQFLSNVLGSDQVGETDGTNNITAIGVGYYSPFNDFPKAAFEIKIPYLAPHLNDWIPNSSSSYGEAFHSIAASDYDHAWRMYTYGGQIDQEKFNIINYSRNSPDVQLEVVQKGNMEFFTNKKIKTGNELLTSKVSLAQLTDSIIFDLDFTLLV